MVLFVMCLLFLLRVLLVFASVFRLAITCTSVIRVATAIVDTIDILDSIDSVVIIVMVVMPDFVIVGHLWYLC